jgi:L,D-transpeptidase YbiS
MDGGFPSAREGALPRPGRVGLVIGLPRIGRPWRWAVGAGLPAVVLAIALGGTGFSYGPAPAAWETPPVPSATSAAALKKEVAKLRGERRGLEAALEKKKPKGTYLIIDQTHNRLQLRKGDQTLLDAKCSAGSGMVLEEGGGKNRRWVFDTPRGQFRVLNKIADPIWKKPDWAFVEEGKPIPRDPEERFERGTLGEYALYFGNGYMVHGTLYERLLGRSVTHGCIRLGREDLRVVWANAPIGTPIYIF